jgi:hypothetical protein
MCPSLLDKSINVISGFTSVLSASNISDEILFFHLKYISKIVSEI